MLPTAGVVALETGGGERGERGGTEVALRVVIPQQVGDADPQTMRHRDKGVELAPPPGEAVVAGRQGGARRGGNRPGDFPHTARRQPLPGVVPSPLRRLPPL